MKTHLAFALIFVLAFTSQVLPQCEYYKFSDPPTELERGRINEYGMRRTHPYTLFVVDNDFNLDATLQQIRNNLFSIVLADALKAISLQFQFISKIRFSGNRFPRLRK